MTFCSFIQLRPIFSLKLENKRVFLLYFSFMDIFYIPAQRPICACVFRKKSRVNHDRQTESCQGIYFYATRTTVINRGLQNEVCAEDIHAFYMEKRAFKIVFYFSKT